MLLPIWQFSHLCFYSLAIWLVSRNIVKAIGADKVRLHYNQKITFLGHWFLRIGWAELTLRGSFCCIACLWWVIPKEKFLIAVFGMFFLSKSTSPGFSWLCTLLLLAVLNCQKMFWSSTRYECSKTVNVQSLAVGCLFFFPFSEFSRIKMQICNASLPPCAAVTIL
jgi:hypothetical protein